MKIEYDNEVDALYIRLSDLKPEGVVELKDSINIDVTPNDEIVGIEILNVSKKMDLNTFLKYEFDNRLIEV
jgi:uncharacterized protein YuzE